MLSRLAVMSSHRLGHESIDRPYAAVLFDFGGTLDADGTPTLDQFLRAYRSAGGVRSAGEFEVIFRESDRQLAADPVTRGLGFQEMVAAQSRLLARLTHDSERVDADQIAASVHDAAAAIAARNLEMLRRLRVSRFQLAAVSNFTGNLARCLSDLNLAPMFEAIVDSAVVGVRKPDSRIFNLALEQLGVSASRALMVGDNPFADIGPAEALGMGTAWLAPLSRPAPPGCAPTFRIESLPELMSQLDPSPERHTRLTACTD
jgi:HAD superfamily hydrolase (TIGR01549 family)